MNGKRVLFIEDRIPYRFLGAGFPRTNKILSSLVDLGYRVTFYSLKKDEYPEFFLKYQSILPSVDFIIGKRYKKNGLESYIKNNGKNFDILLISRPGNMSFLQTILKDNKSYLNSDTKLIYDAEAIVSLRDIQERGLQGEAISNEDKLKMTETELKSAKIADCVWAVSESERNIFIDHDFDPNNVKVIGYTADIRVTNVGFKDRENLLFVGAIHGDNTPNAHSINWFNGFVLPTILKEIPNIKLDIVGINSSPLVKSLENNSLVMHGRVGNTNNFYDNARVFIAPTQFAAGIPLKIIEAAAKGVPIVTTSIIAKLIGWEDGKELLSGDTAEDFAKKCIELYANSSLWNYIRENAYSRIKLEYSELSFKKSLKYGLGMKYSGE